MKLWEKVVVSLGTVLGLGMIFYGLAPEPQPKYKLPVAPVVTISPTPTAYRT